MAPEQIMDSPIQGATVDLYAVGVMLYQMLSGALPFRGADSDSVFRAALRAEPPPLTNLRRDVHPSIARVVRRAMARAPSERFQDARSMRQALLACLPYTEVRRRQRTRASKLLLSTALRSLMFGLLVGGALGLATCVQGV
jgi:serine/threonine-protein kinase